MILSHSEIKEIGSRGNIIDHEFDNINAASLDVRISKILLFESDNRLSDHVYTIIEPFDDASDKFFALEIPEEGILIDPGTFFLASTVESLNLPLNIACDFKLKSSVARIGLSHQLAGWVDPGFEGTLTLEFKNILEYSAIRIHAGMKIGQLVFHRMSMRVDKKFSYKERGQYNGQSRPQVSKGVR